jgi:phosphotransferase system  glucose/maltose/N-acetylglucosamine-specific IIC component
MKDPIQHFIDYFNEYSMPLLDRFFDEFNKVPITTIVWIIMVWIFAAAVIILISVGVLR